MKCLVTRFLDFSAVLRLVDNCYVLTKKETYTDPYLDKTGLMVECFRSELFTCHQQQQQNWVTQSKQEV
jgi:hypothetical protein